MTTIKQLLSNDDITLVEKILFDDLKLDRGITNVQMKGLDIDKVEEAKKYVRGQLKTKDEEMEEWFLYSKGTCYHRLVIFHPDTQKSYLELIYKKYPPTKKKGATKSYASTEIDVHLSPYMEIPLIYDSSDFKKMRLPSGKNIIKRILLYLAYHGAIFEVHQMTELKK